MFLTVCVVQLANTFIVRSVDLLTHIEYFFVVSILPFGISGWLE